MQSSAPRLLDAVGRREDEHRQARGALAPPPEHLEAVQARQAEVDDEQVELLCREHGVGIAAVADLVDGVAGAAPRTSPAISRRIVDVLGPYEAAGRAPAGTLTPRRAW